MEEKGIDAFEKAGRQESNLHGLAPQARLLNESLSNRGGDRTRAREARLRVQQSSYAGVRFRRKRRALVSARAGGWRLLLDKSSG